MAYDVNGLLVNPKGKIYVAGPMQGIPDFNFPAFYQAATTLRSDGWEVFSPAERDDEHYGRDMAKSATGDLKDANAKGFSLREAMEADCIWICRNATAIYMLRGWENSKGARTEHALAVCLGLQIFYQT